MQGKEIWKDVVGFEEYFQVSNFGNVFSKRTNKILSQTISKTGYAQVSTRIGGRKGTPYCFRVHRLVAEAFIDKPDHLLEQVDKWAYCKIPVNHIDGDKLNNCLTNLEWASYSDNLEHAYENNLRVNSSGLDNPLFKLSLEEVFYIKENLKLKDREFGARALSRKLGVSRDTITKVYEMQIPS